MTPAHYLRTVGYLVEARGPGGAAFLIRSEPWNARQDSLGWFAPLVRLAKRDYRWRVRVRRFFDDPYGVAIVDEFVARRSEVPVAIARLEDLIRSGSPPFGPGAP